jgi:hypothetical protein
VLQKIFGLSLVTSTFFIGIQFIGTTLTDLKGLFVGSSSPEPVQAEKNDHASAGGLLISKMVPASVPIPVRKHVQQSTSAQNLGFRFSSLGFLG